MVAVAPSPLCKDLPQRRCIQFVLIRENSRKNSVYPWFKSQMLFAKRTQFDKSINTSKSTNNTKNCAILAQKTNPKRTQFYLYDDASPHPHITEHALFGASTWWP
jgi:hypothetical protein